LHHRVTGEVIKIRAVIAGYTPQLADLAEQRMRAGIRRMQDAAKADGCTVSLVDGDK